MFRDGILEEYKKFGITKEEEIQWRQEYVSYWSSQLSQEDFTALEKLKWGWSFELLADLIALADKGDGFAKLQYAETVFILGLGAQPSPIQEKAIKTAIQIWQALTVEPIVLSDEHKTELWSPMRLEGASSPEDYVRMFAKRQLEWAKTKGVLV